MFPVHSNLGHRHDAYSLLNEADVLSDRKLPENLKLQFDHELYAHKAEFCKQVYDHLKATRPHFTGSKAEQALLEQFDFAYQEKFLQVIREKAKFHNVEITQQEIDGVPNIAVNKSNFDAWHRKGIMKSIGYSTANLMMGAFFSGPKFTVMDFICIPLTSIFVAHSQHRMPTDTKSCLTSMNRVSVPTIATYGIPAAAFYGVDYTLAAMTGSTAGIALMPAALGGVAYVIYQYGPSCASAVVNKCKTIPANMSELCKKVGMKLWGTCHRQEVAVLDEQLASNDLHATLLNTP
jgi:hypothetical protein